MADMVRKWANGVAAVGAMCFSNYRGRGLSPELLLARKWCFVTWISSSAVILCASGVCSG